jgi:hypothetical protein
MHCHIEGLLKTFIRPTVRLVPSETRIFLDKSIPENIAAVGPGLASIGVTTWCNEVDIVFWPARFCFRLDSTDNIQPTNPNQRAVHWCLFVIYPKQKVVVSFSQTCSHDTQSWIRKQILLSVCAWSSEQSCNWIDYNARYDSSLLSSLNYCKFIVQDMLQDANYTLPSTGQTNSRMTWAFGCNPCKPPLFRLLNPPPPPPFLTPTPSRLS